MIRSSIALLLWLLLTSLPLFSLDTDEDGMCNVWESRYGAGDLLPNQDSDQDGWSNLQESRAGTNPFDRSSFLKALIRVNAQGAFEINLHSESGKYYQLYRSENPGGPWQVDRAPLIADLTRHTLALSESSETAFYRIVVQDADSDLDTLSNWAELQMEGFDPHAFDSFMSGLETGDRAAMTSLLTQSSSSGFNASVSVVDALEKEGSDAVITITRSGELHLPLTLYFQTKAVVDAGRGQAEGNDYQTNLHERLLIPAGERSAELRVSAIPDTKIEVPEWLDVTFGPDNASARVRICDAADLPENDRLLIARLRPISGISTTGSGLSVLKLNGSNERATVTVDFSNLAGALTNTQILNTSDSILQSVPPFNFQGQAWEIQAGSNYATDQELLNAIISGSTKLTVYSSQAVSGEIEGYYQFVNGSISFEAPPEAATLAPLTGAELDRDIARFLNQASFGASPDSFAAMQARVALHQGDRMAAFEAWIDAQFALTSPSLYDFALGEVAYLESLTGTVSERDKENIESAWWLEARYGHDQLRQRMAHALLNLFVVSKQGLGEWNRGLASYYEMLTSNAFTSFRDVIEGVATHPIMGHYLSHLQNQKATFNESGEQLTFPDENFAREILQLFSIGLVELHPDGSLKLDAQGNPVETYTQADVMELARLFTGWSFSNYNTYDRDSRTRSEDLENNDFHANTVMKFAEAEMAYPMKNFAAYHDTDAKSILGLEIPAGLSGQAELSLFLDHLAGHPNLAPFICKSLIQRFTTSNPSAGYLYRVATVFESSKGDFRETLKAILLDPEARALDNTDAVVSFGRPREPILRYTALLRATEAYSGLNLPTLVQHGYPQALLDAVEPDTSWFLWNSRFEDYTQQPLFNSPTVFNFFQPDYSASSELSVNGLVSPELQVLNDLSVYSIQNGLRQLIYTSGDLTNSPNPLKPVFPSGYDRVRPDYSHYRSLYLSVLDVTGDGAFDANDTETFDSAEKIEAACAQMLDAVDLLLTGGLIQQSGTTGETPYTLILQAIAATKNELNAEADAALQEEAFEARIKSLFWLITAAPEFIIQR